MNLALHYHPLSSCSHKVLIALEELGIEVDRQVLNLADPAERAAHLQRWPIGKMPLLVDDGRAVPETSVIVEHLQLHHAPQGRRLIPQDAEAALEVRLWDRLFDLYVMTPMQAHTGDLLRAEPDRDPLSVAAARSVLLTAYEFIDRQLEGRTWISGEAFTLADCAAAPSLFYAVTYVPLPPERARVAAYFERLLSRPSVARTLDQARPYFKWYPGRAGLAKRFFDPDVV